MKSSEKISGAIDCINGLLERIDITPEFPFLNPWLRILSARGLHSEPSPPNCAALQKSTRGLHYSSRTELLIYVGALAIARAAILSQTAL